MCEGYIDYTDGCTRTNDMIRFPKYSKPAPTEIQRLVGRQVVVGCQIGSGASYTVYGVLKRLVYDPGLEIHYCVVEAPDGSALYNTNGRYTRGNRLLFYPSEDYAIREVNDEEKRTINAIMLAQTFSRFKRRLKQ